MCPDIVVSTFVLVIKAFRFGFNQHPNPNEWECLTGNPPTNGDSVLLSILEMYSLIVFIGFLISE